MTEQWPSDEEAGALVRGKGLCGRVLPEHRVCILSIGHDDGEHEDVTGNVRRDRREHQREIARRLLAEPAFNTTDRDDEYGSGWNGAIACMRQFLERIVGRPDASTALRNTEYVNPPVDGECPNGYMGIHNDRRSDGSVEPSCVICGEQMLRIHRDG